LLLLLVLLLLVPVLLVVVVVLLRSARLGLLLPLLPTLSPSPVLLLLQKPLACMMSNHWSWHNGT
jgi:hypothetical protein